MIVVCFRERTEKGKTSEETVYSIGSRVMTAKQYGRAFRDHWKIEIGLAQYPPSGTCQKCWFCAKDAEEIESETTC